MGDFGSKVWIARPPEDVYDEVAHVERHGHWSADPLEVTEIVPGQSYSSTATSKGKTIEAQVQVTEAERPRRFAFTTQDMTGEYAHVFTFTPEADGTLVQRSITPTKLKLGQRLLFLAVVNAVKKPSAATTMTKLKERLEHPEGT